MRNLNQWFDLSKEWFGENLNLLLPKIKAYARKGGRMAAKPLLQLYFVLKEDSTPRSEKAWIIAALAYIFIPLDLIPFRKFGLLGWLDESIAISFACKKVKKHITPKINFMVECQLDQWFSDNSVQIIY